MKYLIDYAEWLDKNSDVVGKYNLATRLLKWIEEWQEYKFATNLEDMADEVGDLTTVTALVLNVLEIREVPLTLYASPKPLVVISHDFLRELVKFSVGDMMDKDYIKMLILDACMHLDKVTWLRGAIEDKKLEFLSDNVD